jgi:hypothetical protein
MLVGIYDPIQPVDSPEKTFPTLVKLRAQIIRLDLNWNVVASKQPASPADPSDPAYDWSGYDRTVLNAAKNKIQVLFTIYGTTAASSSATTRRGCPRCGGGSRGTSRTTRSS